MRLQERINRPANALTASRLDAKQRRRYRSHRECRAQELAVADQVLAQRRELAIIAARISPPAYVKSELGERPSDPAKRQTWDRGVAGIERYRQEHGIKDPPAKPLAGK